MWIYIAVNAYDYKSYIVLNAYIYVYIYIYIYVVK